MPEPEYYEDDYVDDEESEIEKIIEAGKEIKLEKKKKPAVKKPETQVAKIEVAPVLKPILPEEKVSYVITTGESKDVQVKESESKISLAEKPELKKIEPEKPQINEIEITKPEEKVVTEQPKTIEQPQETKPAEQIKPVLTAQDIKREPSSANVPRITAQDILLKSEKELKAETSKRETHNLLQDMKIITAILLGKNKNKELSQALQTDKSFTSKQIKGLEEQGLVKREGEGKNVSYEVDSWNVLKFLQGKVLIKWKKDEKGKGGEQTK